MIQRKITTALALAVVTISLAAPAAALIVDETITADHPDDQEVTADFTLDGDVTDHAVELSRDGTVLQSDTVSGVSGDTATATLPLTGLSEGEFNISSADNTNLILDSTTMTVTRTDVVNVSQNDTVTADVAFAADETANATVTFDQSTTTNSTDLSYDPIEADGGSETQTAEYVAEEDGNVTVTVQVTNAHAYGGLWVSAGDETVAGTTSISDPVQHPLAPYAIAVVLVAAAHAYFKDTNIGMQNGGNNEY